VLDSAPEPSPVPFGDADSTGAPAASPRRTLPVERVGAFIEVLLSSGFPTQIVILGVLMGLGMEPRLDDGGLSPRFIIVMSLLDTILVVGLVSVFLRAHHEPVRDFVLGPQRPWREVLLGIALIPAAFSLVVLVLAVILSINPRLHNVTVNPFERMLQTPRDAALFAFVAMSAGGIREEVQRGFIIRRFDQYLGGGVVGLVIYSVVFGLGHLDQGYAAAIATGTLGAAWGYVYLVRRSIVAPMISHAGFNLAQLVKYVTFAAR